MAQISPDDDYATVIVIFRTNQDQQKVLLEQAITNSKTVMEKKDGFISTSLHKNSDNTKIVNLSQWKNKSAYEKTISFLTPEEVLIGEKLMDMGASDWNTYRLAFCSRNNTTKISTENSVTTLINLFTVNPDDQSKLIDTLQDLSSSVVEKNPDFISAAVHQSFDGTKVLSYAQWKSQEAYKQIYQDLEAAPYIEKINNLSKFEWDFFDVVYTS